MKILGMSASPRGAESQTLRLVTAVLEGAREAGAETELVDICRLRINFCTACDTCHKDGACVHKDDFAPFLDKVLAADGLVLGSPNYFRNVTGQMKLVLDRMSAVIHCQMLRGKHGCSVATAGGPAAALVTDYLNGVLLNCGATVVGSVAVSLVQGPEAMEPGLRKAADLGRTLARAIASGHTDAEQKRTHDQTAEYFRRLIERNQTRWPFEHAYWLKRA